MNSLRDFSGYSLGECLMVIVCGAILLAVSVPNLHRFQQAWSLWGGVKLVETSLYWGRLHAISANSPMLFEVNDDGRRFWWTDPDEGLTFTATVRTLPAGIRIASSPGRPLRFYEHGNAVPAGTYKVQGASGSYSVIVSPGGRIRIEKN